MGKPLKKRVHKIASLFDGSGIGGPLKESKAKINKNIVDDQESAVDQSMLEKQHTEVKV